MLLLLCPSAGAGGIVAAACKAKRIRGRRDGGGGRSIPEIVVGQVLERRGVPGVKGR